MPGGHPTPLGDEEFIQSLETIGPAATSDMTGITIRNVYRRRANLERKMGRNIVVAPNPVTMRTRSEDFPGRLNLDMPNGVIMAGGDAHYYPGAKSPAHRGFVKFCKELEPAAVVMNGDVMECGTISRHPSLGWESKPTLQQEIEVAQERLHEIALALKPGTPKFWPLGNHDARFEMRLATVAPEFAKVAGVHLRDHFPDWIPCWSVWINDDLVFKHRMRGGIHATHNNTVNAGKSIATNHLHSAKVTPWTDYNGTRWGVDLGCIASPYGRQFEYMEDNPRNWRSGFGVFTFVDGYMLQPELALVVNDDKIQFRGKIIDVSEAPPAAKIPAPPPELGRRQRGRTKRRPAKPRA